MKLTSVTCRDLPMLFSFIRSKLEEFKKEFCRYGLTSDEGPELKMGTGLLCYYDLKTRWIYISFPDLDTPVGRMQFLFIRDLLGFENDDELARFIFLVMPWLLAHEMGHYHRHFSGRFGTDLWLEEQIANKIANAITKPAYEPDESHLLLDYLKRSVDRLSKEVDVKNGALGSYHSPLSGLNVIGAISAGMVDSLQVIEKLLALGPDQMLRRTETLYRHETDALRQRGELIAGFNRDYGSDIVTYLYYQFGWMLLDLKSREQHYLDELIRLYLSDGERTLPLPGPHSPSEEEIRALYHCHRETLVRSEAVSRFFFKRYRSTLFALIRGIAEADERSDPLQRREVQMMIDSWDEKDCDVLDFVEQTAPLELRPLFPSCLEKVDMHQPLPANPALEETDRRIFMFVMHRRDDDPVARRTVERLILLDGLQGFKSLSADILLELSSCLCLKKCSAGDAIIREGNNNADVFILISGLLEASALTDDCGTQTPLGVIQAGELFGEMAFLTGDPRSATVRATEESECLVLKASDLRIYTYKEPALLFQMARGLASRLKVLDHTLTNSDRLY